MSQLEKQIEELKDTRDEYRREKEKLEKKLKECEKVEKRLVEDKKTIESKSDFPKVDLGPITEQLNEKEKIIK